MPRLIHRHSWIIGPFIDMGHGRMEALRECTLCYAVLVERMYERPRFKLLGLSMLSGKRG